MINERCNYDKLIKYLDNHIDEFVEISDQIWDYAEPRFQEFNSSALQQKYLKSKGFMIRTGLSGEDTAFVAEYGNGKPVIIFLGEFDALPGLSQEADALTRKPVNEDGEGHGCGHNLLGVASLAACSALKEYMISNDIKGTIRYYGCPAEENAGGKTFLVRDGHFKDCDIAITWHPSTITKVYNAGTLANFRVFFTFHGISSHAASCPELGRSALDAVELMDVGVNYMREHMSSQARIHYAITNPGGKAPNVVQSEAQVLYSIRAPRVSEVKELYERVKKIAQGAALMTETTVDIKQVAAYSDYIPNPTISDVLEGHIKEIYPIKYTEQELEYAGKFKQVTTKLDRVNLKSSLFRLFGKKTGAKLLDEPILTEISMQDMYGTGYGSTDVGDVSWVVPTGQFDGTTWAAATAAHSWQATAQGKSSIAHKGMLAAAKVMAMTGLDFLLSPELVSEAKNTYIENLDGETYPNPLPKDVKPEIW